MHDYLCYSILKRWEKNKPGSLLLWKVRHLSLEEKSFCCRFTVSVRKNAPKLHYATSTLLTNVHQICSNTIIAKESHLTKRNLLLQRKYKIWEKQTLGPVTWNKYVLGHLKSSFCIHDLVAATLLTCVTGLGPVIGIWHLLIASGQLV